MLASYGIVSELLHPTEFKSFILYPSAFALLFNFLVKIAIVKPGSDLTEEAEKTSVLVSKIMNVLQCSESQKADLLMLFSQVKARRVNVQNKMFTLNWGLLLAASY